MVHYFSSVFLIASGRFSFFPFECTGHARDFQSLAEDFTFPLRPPSVPLLLFFFFFFFFFPSPPSVATLCPPRSNLHPVRLSSIYRFSFPCLSVTVRPPPPRLGTLPLFFPRRCSPFCTRYLLSRAACLFPVVPREPPQSEAPPFFCHFWVSALSTPGGFAASLFFSSLATFHARFSFSPFFGRLYSSVRSFSLLSFFI